MRRLLASVSLAAMMIAAGPALAEIKQGGEMVVTFKDDLITLDPAIGYDWKNWSVIKSVFDGLMDYKPGTTELVPDLAESLRFPPTASPTPSSCARASSSTTAAR